MLTEDEVLQAVKKHLLAQGLRVETVATSSEHGPDLVATPPDGRWQLVVEAKGQTSSRSASARFGKEFDGAQVQSHVARAFFTAAAALSGDPSGRTRGAIALPNTSRHREQVRKIERAVRILGLGVFLVEADGSVQELAQATSKGSA